MKNEEIAKLVAEAAYRINENDMDFAIQLFIEDMVLPDFIDEYNAKIMEAFVLEKLRSRKSCR